MKSSLYFMSQKLIRSQEQNDSLAGAQVWITASDKNVPGIVLNRTSEVISDNLRQTVAIVTCQAPEALQAEDLGERAIAVLHAVNDFECDGVTEIEFVKGSVDVTSFDLTRDLFLREIEFVVSW